ncbi:ABC transporter permease subunit [Candidatus Berkelbacteria bacterium]|nr:ABC transporter permease subunit [Candidatus Berkelbacteria bacterium]
MLIFIKFNFSEGAAIFILVMAMLWNLVFSMIGGLKTIPQDIIAAANIFKARGLKKVWYITLPAIVPYMITGSLLAWAQGWNIIIVAEALHNYIPGSSSNDDLFGIGSLLVNASYQGNTLVFVASLVIMILLIGIMNFFVWQKLLHAAERYKFD